MKIATLFFILLPIQLFAKTVIRCEPGLIFIKDEKRLHILMDNNPYENLIVPYFQKSSRSVYKEDMKWSYTLNSFYAQDSFSTVHLFKYFNENSISLVVFKEGYQTLKLKFYNCQD